MSRVPLSQIRSLTLYKGELTKARRLQPILQLKCVGKACKLFQPDVVRCYNTGGSGVDIDWTCEADLPEKLRFGRIDVSCEGWSQPGDPYVLKGSCGLEYRLVNISDSRSSDWFKNLSWNDLFERVFLWTIILVVIYLFFGQYILGFLNWLKRSLGFGNRGSSSSSSRPRPSNFYSGGRPSDYPPPPPPPYSEQPKPSSSSWFSRPDPPTSSSSSPSGPGFWSGMGLGGLGGLAAAHLFRGGGNAPTPRYTTQEYDWEGERRGLRRGGGLFGSSWSFPGSSYTWRQTPVVRSPSSNNNDDDRGEGPSNLGRVRRSTGYGVTNVR